VTSREPKASQHIRRRVTLRLDSAICAERRILERLEVLPGRSGTDWLRSLLTQGLCAEDRIDTQRNGVTGRSEPAVETSPPQPRRAGRTAGARRTGRGSRSSQRSKAAPGSVAAGEAQQSIHTQPPAEAPVDSTFRSAAPTRTPSPRETDEPTEATTSRPQPAGECDDKPFARLRSLVG